MSGHPLWCYLQFFWLWGAQAVWFQGMLFRLRILRIIKASVSSLFNVMLYCVNIEFFALDVFPQILQPTEDLEEP